jgi:GntR family transcriptional regulator, carbon starvation induced regulator
MTGIDMAAETTDGKRALRPNQPGQTVTTLVVERLRADILGVKFQPGEKLLFRALRARYGVGTSPLREALTRLAADGFVVLEDQRGFRVAPVSRADLEDVTMLRQQLETAALSQAIANGDEEWEVKVMAAFHRLSKLPEHEPGDAYIMNPQWARRHEEFHEALASACGSPRLLQFRKMLFDQSERYRRLSKVYGAQPRDVLAEHKAIMDATLSRDTSLATALLAEHLGRTAAMVLDGMTEDADTEAYEAAAVARA